MSGTRRVPIARRSAAQITPAALEAFRRIRLLETQCACSPVDWEGAYWKHEPCPACDEWWVQQGIICRELALKPWHWPAVEDPEMDNPYPEGSFAAAEWRPNAAACALWRVFDEAASEPRRGRRKRAHRSRAEAPEPAV
jgi:hypothetical protein